MENDTALAASKYMILAATSGDTGVAAIRGIQLGAPDVKIMVLYPEHGVSPVQRQQMLACNGGNVKVVGVESDFDFCQGTVKKVFNSKEIVANLSSKCGTVLSSANSINWGRLLPQMVYYFWAYNRLVRSGRITLPSSGPLPFIDVCVPTGNFGNILSGFFAKRIGLPVRRFVLASNRNDVLTEFVRTGAYDLTERTLHVTASPSIDILRASNLERLLFYLTNYDGAAVRGFMTELDEAKKFKVDAALHALVASDFTSYSCDEATCAAEIEATCNATRNSASAEAIVLPDPHTAVAIRAAHLELASRGQATTPADATPLVVMSTAHWAKFPKPVLRAIDPAAADKLDADGAAENVLALFDAVRAACPGTWVAQPLVEAFEAKRAGTSTPALEGFPADMDAIINEMMAFAAAE
jgi:threonine synthase